MKTDRWSSKAGGEHIYTQIYIEGSAGVLFFQLRYPISITAARYIYI
jgi:hypothetical protein